MKRFVISFAGLCIVAFIMGALLTMANNHKANNPIKFATGDIVCVKINGFRGIVIKGYIDTYKVRLEDLRYRTFREYELEACK